ncbi:hypothetical protein KDX38_00205 [Pseudomonas sp. CDFA 602]|uniref:hypothetical protein n=1 Tax=Pseudomonas californiensis TaxID=2829823 RepID=UPI001E2AC4FA|nr:hypothetical protein [Pseudomonas californiensis]MCD5992032.1 hypothetical protein [Pseudomonas californiensis]MCD5997640.1 hypothetical protein [Pseudomonas californiensis]
MASYEIRLTADDFKKTRYPKIEAELYENNELLSSIFMSVDTQPEEEIAFEGDSYIAKHVLVDVAFSFRKKISKLPHA